jgi:hypothetical protein
MADNPDDLINKLKSVDKTTCGLCKRPLVGASYLGNVDGQLVSLCRSCKFGKKKK